MGRLLKNLLWAGSALLFAGCGGGGSSGDNVTVTFEDTTLEASGVSNEFSMVNVAVDFSFSSVPDAGLYISFEFTQSGVTSVEFRETGDTTGQILVYLKSPNSLGAGVYRDTVRVAVCFDEDCVKQVRGSPKTLSVIYTVTDPTTLSVDKKEFKVRAGFGGSAPVVSVLATLSGPDAAMTNIRLTRDSADSAFIATEVVQLSDTQRRVDFHLADPDDAAVGQHFGSFFLDACHDPECLRQADNGHQRIFIDYAVSQFAQQAMRKVQTGVSDVVWDAVAQKFYLSFPSTAASNRNSIAILDPSTGNLTASVAAGNEPKHIAVSDDGTFLYVASGDTAQVRRFKLPALTPDITIDLGRNPSFGPRLAYEIAVAPGQPKTLAVNFISDSALAIYDDNVRRGSMIGDDEYFPSTTIAWSADATHLFAYYGYSNFFELH
uniref:YncE family protein n=1 Tax=uncultured Nevskia sp. TaxID=228950 RepID=UPI0025EA9856